MNGAPWTKREDAYLRRWRGKRSDAQIAEQLGRSPMSVKCRAQKIGLVQRRMWTERELRYLRTHVGSMPRVEIARRLGRTPSQVYQAVARYCPNQVQWRTCVDERWLKRMRSLHARGYSDAEIADKLGCERHTVGDWRRRLGLADNTRSERRRRRVAEKTRKQLEAEGLRSLGELRVKAFRDRARAAGWPDDLRPRAVQVLNALWDHGPMTRRELADAIGMPWKGSRKSLTSDDPEGSYLAHLMRRGLVVNLGRIAKGKGRGRSANVYSLPLTIERRAAE